MNYEDLKAAELRALCEEKGIKPSRAKADMIEDLKARDAADELTRLGQEMELQDGEHVLSGSFIKALEVEVPVPAEKPAERPVEVLNLAEGDGWVEDGTFYKAFERAYALDEYEHASNLRKVVQLAFMAGHEPYGPPYRAAQRTTPRTWIYGVNVRR